MSDIRILSDAELDLVAAAGRKTVNRGGRGGDAVAISAAVVYVGGDVKCSTITATSGDATATGGAGGAVTT
jgi:hypothetical protein